MLQMQKPLASLSKFLLPGVYESDQRQWGQTIEDFIKGQLAEIQDMLAIGGVKVWVKRSGCFAKIQVFGYVPDNRDLIEWSTATGFSPN